MSGIEWVTSDGVPTVTENTDAGHDRRSRPGRRSLIVGAVFVLALVSGGVALALHKPAPKPRPVSVAGTPVDHAKQTIAAADKQFLAYTRANGGALTKQSRCYFARLRPDSDDVATTIYCGAVLFAHGSAPDYYLAYELTSTPAPHRHLALAVQPKPVSPVPVPHPLQELERPDRTAFAQPPADLSAPPALALPMNSLSTFDPTTVDENFPISVLTGMGSAAVVVQLNGAAFLGQVGAGADTRRAPTGGRLLAFGVSVLSNGFGSLEGVPYSVGLQIGDGVIRALPSLRSDDNLYSASGDFVVAVSVNATSIRLVFDGAGFRQTLSLPRGEPGPDNVQLYAQPATTTFDDTRSSVDVQVDDHGRRFDTSAEVNVSNSQLVYFTTYGITPSRRDRAFLHPDVCFVSKETTGGDDCVDLGAAQLALSVDGHETPARDIAPGPASYPVFEVPANFAQGVLIVRGTYTTGGVTMTFTQPFEYDVVFNNTGG